MDAIAKTTHAPLSLGAPSKAALLARISDHTAVALPTHVGTLGCYLVEFSLPPAALRALPPSLRASGVPPAQAEPLTPEATAAAVRLGQDIQELLAMLGIDVATEPGTLIAAADLARALRDLAPGPAAVGRPALRAKLNEPGTEPTSGTPTLVSLGPLVTAALEALEAARAAAEPTPPMITSAAAAAAAADAPAVATTAKDAASFRAQALIVDVVMNFFQEIKKTMPRTFDSLVEQLPHAARRARIAALDATTLIGVHDALKANSEAFRCMVAGSTGATKENLLNLDRELDAMLRDEGYSPERRGGHRHVSALEIHLGLPSLVHAAIMVVMLTFTPEMGDNGHGLATAIASADLLNVLAAYKAIDHAWAALRKCTTDSPLPPPRDCVLAVTAALLRARRKVGGACTIPDANLATGPTSFIGWLNQGLATATAEGPNAAGCWTTVRDFMSDLFKFKLAVTAAAKLTTGLETRVATMSGSVNMLALDAPDTHFASYDDDAPAGGGGGAAAPAQGHYGGRPSVVHFASHDGGAPAGGDAAAPARVTTGRAPRWSPLPRTPGRRARTSAARAARHPASASRSASTPLPAAGTARAR